MQLPRDGAGCSSWHSLAGIKRAGAPRTASSRHHRADTDRLCRAQHRATVSERQRPCWRGGRRGTTRADGALWSCQTRGRRDFPVRLQLLSCCTDHALSRAVQRHLLNQQYDDSLEVDHCSLAVHLVRTCQASGREVRANAQRPRPRARAARRSHIPSAPELWILRLSSCAQEVVLASSACRMCSQCRAGSSARTAPAARLGLCSRQG